MGSLFRYLWHKAEVVADHGGGIVSSVDRVSPWNRAPSVLWVCSILFFMIAVVAATHDIAIDGFYLEALDEQQQSHFRRLSSHGLQARHASGGRSATHGYRPHRLVLGLLYSRGGDGTSAWDAPICTSRYRGRTTTYSCTVDRPSTMAGTRIVQPLSVRVLCLSVAHVARTIWGHFVERITKTLPIVGQLSLEGWIGLLLLLGLLGALAALPWMHRAVHRSESQYALAFVHFLEQPRVGRISPLCCFSGRENLYFSK